MRSMVVKYATGGKGLETSFSECGVSLCSMVPILGPFLPTQSLNHLYPSSQVIVCWGVCTSTSGSLLGPLSHRPEVSLVVGTGKSCGAR